MSAACCRGWWGGGSVDGFSFVAWAGREVAHFDPFVERRGGEVEAQLVRDAIEAVGAFWDSEPAARIAHAHPVIRVVVDGGRPVNNVTPSPGRLRSTG